MRDTKLHAAVTAATLGVALVGTPHTSRATITILNPTVNTAVFATGDWGGYTEIPGPNEYNGPTYWSSQTYKGSICFGAQANIYTNFPSSLTAQCFIGRWPSWRDHNPYNLTYTGYANMAYSLQLDQAYSYAVTVVHRPDWYPDEIGSLMPSWCSALGGTLAPGTYPDFASVTNAGEAARYYTINFTPIGSPSATPLPSPQIAAALSNNIYHGTDGFGGYTNIGTKTDPRNAGFLASGYCNGDPNAAGAHIVIAFRGTEVGRGVGIAWSDLAADASFLSNIATASLSQQVEDAANYVREMQTAYPTADITLTGHSLGGAVAQLVGKAAGLATYAVDAPGAGQLYGSLTTALGSFPAPTATAPNTNYREYGDPVSQVGTPIGTTISLARPQTVIYTTPGVDLKRYALENLGSFLTAHDAATAFQQINTFSTEPPSGEAQLGTIFNITLRPEATIATNMWRIGGLISDNFTQLIGVRSDRLSPAAPSLISEMTPSLSLWAPGTDFILTRDASSPSYAAVVFASIDGVSSYRTRYEVLGLWSDWQSVAPGTESLIGDGATAVEFGALDAQGQVLNLSDPLFGIRFASTGDFSGTLTMTVVPEPSSLSLLALGATAILRRRRLGK